MGVRARYKHIQDPLYGMVYLSDLEMRVVDSEAFQRLLNVKQLGYAFAVFPSADYSRFSHCVGVFNVMREWMKTLKDAGSTVDAGLAAMYRLAALLHDLGHYPFSHATEHAGRNYYAQLKQEEPAEAKAEPVFLDHEAIGGFILQNDSEIRDAITNAGLSVEAVQRVYKRYELDPMAALLSSDLDADRVDFLRRTAHHSGLPYGRADAQYLIKQLRLDDQDRPCWTEKALSAIDHLLIGRYFDYQQVVYNKTVVALEEVLQFLVQEMLRRGIVDLSKEEVKRRLADGSWIQFDDHYMFGCIRELKSNASHDYGIVALCESLLSRNPPRQVYTFGYLGSFDHEQQFARFTETCKHAVKDLCKELGLDERWVFVWSSQFRFTKYRGGPEINSADPRTAQELHEVPRILLGDGAKSIPVIQHRFSLTRLVYTKRLFELRVYVLFPDLMNRSDSRDARLRRKSVSSKFRRKLEQLRREILGEFPEQTRSWHEAPAGDLPLLQ